MQILEFPTPEQEEKKEKENVRITRKISRGRVKLNGKDCFCLRKEEREEE